MRCHLIAFRIDDNVYAMIKGTAIVSAIAAIGRNRELGKNNELIWKIPEDLKRLRSLTVGHPVIMGRKTFDSIIAYRGTPLPDRQNIVVTRDPSWAHEGVITASSVEAAIAQARNFDQTEIFVLGGTQIFEAALPYTDKLYLTLIDADAEADSFFPLYETEFTKKVFDVEREWEGVTYHFTDFEREKG